MKWFYDMKIGTKLIAAFVVTGVITAIVGVLGISGMGKIADLAAFSYADETVAIRAVRDDPGHRSRFFGRTDGGDPRAGGGGVRKSDPIVGLRTEGWNS
jgi:hypothetical protein